MTSEVKLTRKIYIFVVSGMGMYAMWFYDAIAGSGDLDLLGIGCAGEP